MSTLLLFLFICILSLQFLLSFVFLSSFQCTIYFFLFLLCFLIFPSFYLVSFQLTLLSPTILLLILSCYLNFFLSFTLFLSEFFLSFIHHYFALFPLFLFFVSFILLFSNLFFFIFLRCISILNSEMLPHLVFFMMNVRNRFIYWSDATSDQLFRSNLDGSEVLALANGTHEDIGNYIIYNYVYKNYKFLNPLSFNRVPVLFI